MEAKFGLTSKLELLVQPKLVKLMSSDWLGLLKPRQKITLLEPKMKRKKTELKAKPICRNHIHNFVALKNKKTEGLS